MKKQKPFVIAIDGYASTGKSTLAKKIAEKLQCLHIDTGAMYRAVTYFLLQQSYDFSKKELSFTEKEKLEAVQLRFEYNPATAQEEIHLNGQNIEKKIRTLEVSKQVSNVAAISEVRQLLVAQQRELAGEKSLVMDGRDIGTVVFPKAIAKLYLNASPEIRAQRRYEELQEKGIQASLAEVRQNITERDYKDSHRKASPLKKAVDAYEIDTGRYSSEEVLAKALAYIQQCIQ